MSKLIAQGFFSLLISLGLIAGANSNVRGEITQVWHETKAIVQQTVDSAMDTVGDLNSQPTANVNVEAGAEANTETGTVVNLSEASNDVQTGAEADAQSDASVEVGTEDGSLLNLNGDANTGLNIDLKLWK